MAIVGKFVVVGTLAGVSGRLKRARRVGLAFLVLSFSLTIAAAAHAQDPAENVHVRVINESGPPLILQLGGKSFQMGPGGTVASAAGEPSYSVRLLSAECSTLSTFSMMAGERFVVTVARGKTVTVEPVDTLEAGPGAREADPTTCPQQPADQSPTPSALPAELVLALALFGVVAITSILIFAFRR